MPKEDLIQHFRNLGNGYFKNKNYSEAITNYKRGLALDGENPNLNNNIAQAYLETKDYENAEIFAKLAIDNSPCSPKGYFRAAKASAGLGNINRALGYLRTGIDSCEDKKDLRDYYRALHEDGTISHAEHDLSEDIPALVSDSDTDDSVDDDKLRSQSTSRVTTDITKNGSQKELGNHRSISMSRTSSASSTNSKTNKKSKKKKGPIEVDDIIKDRFLKTLETIKKDKGVQNATAEQMWKMKRKDFNTLLKEGSEVMARGLSRKAVENYKAALDMILEHSIEDFRIREVEFLALKYALCVAWIELANCADVAKAIEHLTEIEDTRASKFPAVFYGLGSAYYKLNRFKASTEHLEKGLLFLNRPVKFEVLSWPGTNNIIPETTRSGLEELLEELLKTCRTYHEPDAICRYRRCLTLSSHLIPSEHIYYSDPDFCGFVVVFCEEKCKIEYHVGCWKEYKEISSSNAVGKLSDKDFIGRECPTTDCLNQFNNRSTIVKIEIVGDDTTIKTCIEAPKTDLLLKESKKSKKKKIEKSSDTTNLEKQKSKNRQKVKKTVVETLQPIPQQEVLTTNSAEELESKVSKLALFREVKFGYPDDEIFDPSKIFYGRIEMQNMDNFLIPEFDNDTAEDRAKKEFVFSFFYEYIKSEGPQKLKEVEQKWQNEVVEYEDVKDFMKSQPTICNFLLQSFRFAAIDDYICLAEQLPDTYNRAKTELCESLSFTLFEQASPLNAKHDVIQNESIMPNDNIDISSPEKLSDETAVPPTDSDNKNIVDEEDHQTIKLDVANGSMPENFVDMEVEDPDIDTSDSNIMKQRTALLSVSESIVSEGDADPEIDVDSDAEDDDSEDKKEEEEAEAETKEDLISNLNPNAGEFQVDDKNIEKQKSEHVVTSGFLENNTIQENAFTSKQRNEDSTMISDTIDITNHHHQPWSLEDSIPREVSRFVPPLCLPSPYLGSFSAAPPVRPPPQIALNNTYVQTDVNMMGEISKLQKRINQLEKKLDESKKTHEKEKISFEEEKKKRAQETKLENAKIRKEMEKENNLLKEKITKLEKEITNFKENKTKQEKENTVLKEMMTKLGDEFKSEKARLEKEKLELEKSNDASKEQLRDLISKTGQQVKELEKERDQYQELILRMKREIGELKIGIYKQKCKDIRRAMIRREGLSETESSEMTRVILALQECETALKGNEEQLKAKCDSVAKKIGNISSGEFFNIEWPQLPIRISALETMEELTQKLTEEKRDFEKSLADGKHTAKLNVDEPKSHDDPFTSLDHLINSTELVKRQNRASENLDGKSNVKMEDTLGSIKEPETNAQKFHHLNNMQNGLPKAMFVPNLNPSAGVPLFQQTLVANQGYRHMSPYYYDYTKPAFPIVPMLVQQGAVPPRPPIVHPAYLAGSFLPNDKPPVRLQEIQSPLPATEPKPIALPVSSNITDIKTDQPNIPKLAKDVKDLMLPGEKVSINRTGPETTSVSPAFDMASISTPSTIVIPIAAKPTPTLTAASVVAMKPKLVAINCSSATTKKAGSSYQKLMMQLHKNFPTKTEDELAASVAEVREKNNNSLSGLALPAIINKVDRVLKERANKKQGMGLDKFGGTAWGGVRVSTSSWSKPKDNSDGDCPICMEPLEKDLTSLLCKHCFHTECIKKWLRTNSICPNCRVFTKLEEEFPPLS